MLDVVLYRIDDRGTLQLQERPFATILRLAYFFASDAADIWDWAEVTVPCRCQLRRYSADVLRAMVASD